tara:strand:+ start:413 stop:745 length:333 start_codon:yes stop_codon:yes gene_type:complete
MNRVAEFMGWTQENGNDIRTKLHACCICAHKEFTTSPQTYPDWELICDEYDAYAATTPTPYDRLKDKIKACTCKVCQQRHPEYFEGDSHVLGKLAIEFDDGDFDVRRDEE